MSTMPAILQKPAEVVLKAVGLRKEYEGRVAVHDISILLKRGEVLGLLGPNGAGKTTTFGMLYGAVIPTEGSVQVLKYDLFSESGQARKEMGIVPQDNNLDSDFTVSQNLVQFARYCGASSGEATEKVRGVLERLQLEPWAHQKPGTLSGGLVRRAMLGRALLVDPAVVFLDEPTTGLDPDVRQDFWRLVLELKRQGKAILLTTHYMDEASRLCDRLILLQSGRVVDSGTPSSIVRRVVGDEVIEISGGTIDRIQTFIAGQVNWMAPFSNGVIASLAGAEPTGVLQQVMALHPSRFVRRPASLEDVFLKLTGTPFDRL